MYYILTRRRHGVAKRSGESSPHVNRVVPALAVMRQRRIIPVLLEIRRQTVSFTARQVRVVRYWAKIAYPNKICDFLELLHQPRQ